MLIRGDKIRYVWRTGEVARWLILPRESDAFETKGKMRCTPQDIPAEGGPEEEWRLLDDGETLETSGVTWYRDSN
jgi:hypothetical protein